MKTIEPPDPKTLPETQYTNHVLMAYDLCVIKVFFGETTSAEEDGRLKVGVVMTPAFAKHLLGCLSKQLHEYEKAHGAIPTAGAES